MWWVPFCTLEKTMGIKACAAGFCCADVYQNIGVFYPTGNGIDWGIHLARMGVSVSAVSVVGKDEYGDKMREALAAEGLDISHLRVEDGDTSVMLMTSFIPTCLAIVWTSCPNGMKRARRWLWTSRCSARIPNMHVRLIFLT